MHINKRIDSKNGTVQVQISDGSSIQIQTSGKNSIKRSNKWWPFNIDDDTDNTNKNTDKESDISYLLDEMSDVYDDIEDNENVEQNKKRFLELMTKLQNAANKEFGSNVNGG